MARKMEFEDAAARLKNKFPTLRLLSFDGTEKPVRINCPLHGEQTVSRFSNLMKSAKGCPECGYETLRNKDDASDRRPSSSEPAYVKVPLHRDGGLSGPTNESVPFSRHVLRKSGVPLKAAVCMSVRGDRMAPAMPDGAVVGINRSNTTIRNGKVYVFVQGGLLRVKQLYLLPRNRVGIRSLNPAYTDEGAEMSELEIIGHVFWWSALDF